MGSCHIQADPFEAAWRSWPYRKDIFHQPPIVAPPESGSAISGPGPSRPQDLARLISWEFSTISMAADGLGQFSDLPWRNRNVTIGAAKWSYAAVNDTGGGERPAAGPRRFYSLARRLECTAQAGQIMIVGFDNPVQRTAKWFRGENRLTGRYAETIRHGRPQ